MFEMIQYKDNPVGKLKENTAISSGIIQSIMVWLPCCLASVAGTMVIFCCTQVVTNTKTGMNSRLPGPSARSIPKKVASRGAAS